MVDDQKEASASHIITCQKKWVPTRTFLIRPDLPWFGFQCRTAAEEKYQALKRLKKTTDQIRTPNFTEVPVKKWLTKLLGLN